MSSSYPVIDFIVSDIAKAARTRRRALILGFCLAFACISIALIWRDDYNGMWTATYLSSSVGMLVLLGCFPTLYSQSRRRIWLIIAAVIAGLSFAHPNLPLGTVYSSDTVFWQEAWRCFGKGLVTGAGIGTALIFALFTFFPSPPPHWHLPIAIAAGSAGIAMLNLHCMSEHVGHIAIGHVGQAVPVIGIIWLVEFLWFNRLWRSLRQGAPK